MRHRVRLQIDAAHLPPKNATHEPPRETLATFAYVRYAHKKTAPAWAHRGRLCRNCQLAGDYGSPAEVRALVNELGDLFAAIFLDLLQALILSLRIADGFGQHLAQLGLGVCRLLPN